MKNKPEIKKVLVISTGHLTREVNEVMERGGGIGIIYEDVDYGYIIRMPSDFEEWKEETNLDDVPKCIMDIVSLTRSLGCDWCNLDCDGEKSPNLPFFEW